jgi:type IV secretion system protein VirD4
MPRAQPHTISDNIVAGVVVAVGALWSMLWVAAALSSRLSGAPAPPPSIASPIKAFAHADNPAVAWGQPVGPALLYWGIIFTTFTVGLSATVGFWSWTARLARRGEVDPARVSGMASRRDVARAAGRWWLLARADGLRPSLPRPDATDLGYRLGRSRGLDCYCSVEDSLVVLGPPRSGKGLHLVIPTILDAPGAVITTSTRPDNLTATLRARTATGPVAVFDPQRLAPGIPSATRWSPIRGCQNPQTALVRAKALTTDAASGTTDANFWQASAKQAVRALLHAAALAGRTCTDLYRWSLSAVQAREAVLILSSHPKAAPAWHQGLESIVTADQRQRDSVWAMVSIAFAALADPKVLAAVSPAEGEEFDPETFLRAKGTVYLLGTSTGAAATAGLVGAFVEDVVEAARRIAAVSPAARLDPPLSLILDEAANYPRCPP